MEKVLAFNQENVEPKQYIYYPSGLEKAILVHILKESDCSACYEKKDNLFTDGKKVYQRIWHTGE
jgi:hypothetical protein